MYLCSICVFVCMVACCSFTDSLARSKPDNRDPDSSSLWTRYARRFEDRPASQLVDLDWFVQCRPDGDQTRNRVISCEYLFLLCIFLLFDWSWVIILFVYFNAHGIVIISCKRITIFFFKKFYFIVHDDSHPLIIVSCHVCQTNELLR